VKQRISEPSTCVLFSALYQGTSGGHGRELSAGPVVDPCGLVSF
jgi:hypothetical protein